jgi:CheY-like chemotaxis protein
VDRTRTVLICDDDAMIGSVEERMLADAGWEVVSVVSTAVAAIAVTRAMHPSVVVTDLSMAGVSGIDAIGDLVAAGSVVVVCSAFPELRERAIAAGASAVVDKAELMDLTEVVGRLVPA